MRPGRLGRGHDRLLVVDQAPVAEADVLPRRELVMHEVLEQDRDVGPQLGLGSNCAMSTPSHRTDPEAGEYKAGQDLGQRRLPRPVLADQRDDVALGKLHRDIVQ